jgi:hypothetical protein
MTLAGCTVTLYQLMQLTDSHSGMQDTEPFITLVSFVPYKLKYTYWQIHGRPA